MSYVSKTVEVSADIDLDVTCDKCGGDLEADVNGDDLTVEPCKVCCVDSPNNIGDNLYDILNEELNKLDKFVDLDSNILNELKSKIETYRILNK